MILAKRDLLNRALLRVGQGMYQSFDEADIREDNAQNPGTVQICNSVYPSSRAELLCMYYWEFASEICTLTMDDTYGSNSRDYNPLFKYRYKPLDNMVQGSPAQLYLADGRAVGEYFIRQGWFLANDRDLCIKYIREIGDNEPRPPLFDSLHVLYLAQKLSAYITVSDNQKQLLEMEFEKTFAAAKNIDAKTAYQGTIITVTG